MSHVDRLTQVAAVLGSQWGDEGKGKIVDLLGQKYDICARFNGGSNAGHSIKAEGIEFAFHLMPSGILNRQARCLIGNGCVVHLPSLFKELADLKSKGVDYKGRVFISDRTHLVFTVHQTIDGLNEDDKSQTSIGTTRKGIGPAYCEKMNRTGVRAGDLRDLHLFREKFTRIVNGIKKRFPSVDVDIEAEIKLYTGYAKELDEMLVDGVAWINKAHKEGKKILIEGANAALLDIDFGTYPYVTSSNPTIGGALTGLGLSHQKLGDVIGVVKAYTTRVGEGPFPTELHDAVGTALREVGHEFGTTTGRPRRCGWFDAVVVSYSNLLNGYTALNLTKLDVLTGLKDLKIAVAYKHKGEVLETMPASLDVLSKVEVVYETLPGWSEDISKVTRFSELPENCQKYVNRIEQLVGVPIKWIGNGPQRDAMIEK